MPKLIISGTTHVLTQDVITIGRAPENTLCLEDASVSSRHAELRASDQTYRLRDLRSTNGTEVNGRSALEITLRHGDRIRFGAVQARYEDDVRASSVQPLPAAQKAQARPAETSARPADFANASPFRARKKERDPIRKMLLFAVLIALVALMAAIVAVLTMHAPT